MPPSDPETTRRATLLSHALPDSLPEPAFDALVEAASIVCGCPIALISLVDEAGTRFAASVGWAGSDLPREPPHERWFCAHALDPPTFLEVPDATRDARFARHPLVTGGPRIRFYAGQPVVVGGTALGTICVIDHAPRALTPDQRAVLVRLATAVAALLEGRMDAVQSRQEALRLQEAELRLVASEKRLRDIADNLPALLCYVDRDDVYHFANATYAKWMGVDHRSMVGRTVREVFPPEAYRVVSAQAERARAGERLSFERSEMRDGREVHYRVEMIPDHGPDGTVLGVYAMTTDVTERYEAERRLARSEQRLLDITNNIPAVIGVFDLQDRCLFSNDVGLRVIGVERPQLASVTFRSHLEPDVYEQHLAALNEVHAGRRAVAHCQHRVAGKTRWFEAHLVPALEDGRQYGFFAMSFDVTTLKNAEAARASSETRLRQITDNLPVLISHFDAEERLTYVNETFRLWIGGGSANLVGLRLNDAIGQEIYAQRKPYIDRCLAGERVTFEIDSLFTTGARTLQTTYLPDFLPDGGIAGMTSLSIDVTDLKDAERRLSLLAHSDALTGLPNRLQFNGRLVEMLARDAAPACVDAVMFLDVDHFKRINDTHGHATGDAVLQRFAQRVKRSVRSTDFVARLAGDEFVVLLYGLRDAAEAHDIGRKVVEQTARPLRINGKAIDLTASVGVAVREAGKRTPADLLARADEALYRAKEAGRNTVRLAA